MRLKRLLRRLFAVLAAFMLLAMVGLLAFAWYPSIHHQPLSVEAARIPTCGSIVANERYTAAVHGSREIVKGFMHAHGVPGLQIAVGTRGTTAWSEGFGYGDLENHVPVCREARFNIASVSKSVTSAAVGLLYQEGRLDLDAAVQQYVPSFPDKGYTITVRQLGAHRAGIRHYRTAEEELNRKRYTSVQGSLAIFKDDPLLYRPGKRASYSSYGWVLVSAAIEGASGEDFLSYMHQHVFGPLGMTHTAEDTGDLTCGRVHDYAQLVDGHIRSAPRVDFSSKWAAGGFVSTAEDLVRYGLALQKGDFLKPDTLKVLFTSQRRPLELSVPTGIGWVLFRDLRLRRIVFHTGGAVGSTAVLVLYPDHQLVIAVLENIGHTQFTLGRLTEIADEFLQSE